MIKNDRIVRKTLRVIFACAMICLTLMVTGCSPVIVQTDDNDFVSNAIPTTAVIQDITSATETMTTTSTVRATMSATETTIKTTVSEMTTATTTSVTEKTTAAQPEPTTTEKVVYQNPMEALKDYEKTLSFLQDRGETYTLYYHIREWEWSTDWGAYCDDTNLIAPMCRIISDFDRDDSPELLVVEIDSDYMLNAKMYEVIDGTVQLASESKLAISVETTENAHVRCVTYRMDGGIRIGFANDSRGNLYSDGRELQFTVLSYEDQSFCEMGRTRIAGSWMSEETKLEYEEELKLLMGVPVTFEDAWSKGAEGLVKLLPNTKVFGWIDTTCLWSYEEWGDVEPGENDPPLHLSNIKIK